MVLSRDPLSYQISIPCKTRRITPRSKPRSLHYKYAKEALWGVQDLGIKSLDLEEVIKHYELWRSDYHDKFLHLAKEDHHIFMRAFCRFSEHYRSALKHRMKRMTDIDWAVKLEITLDPKQFLGLYDEFERLPRIWNTVSRWLSRTYGKFEYLWILELQKTGRPHYHILISFHDPQWQHYFRSMRRKDKNHRFQAFYAEFKAVVGRNGGGWVWARPIQGNIKLVSYVLKYVNKSISQENVQYSALLFASNRRLFGVSKGLRVFSAPKKEPQGFEYLGCVGAGDLKSYCQEQGIPFGFHVILDSVDPAAAYSHPQLFQSSGGS